MYRIIVRMKSSSAVPSPNWGSMMHGMLIEHLAGCWPAALHDQNSRPVSQWVESIGENRLNWHVQITDNDLAVCFLNACQKGDEWFCQHNGSRLTVEHIFVSSQSLQEYMESHTAAPLQRFLTIHFKTATTHKSQGRYVLFPTPQLIANNIRNRLTGLDDSILLPDEQLDIVVNRTEIAQYHLQTVMFNIEGGRIKGYTGYVDLAFSGNEGDIRFANMLFGLAQWFGVGIKTVLGMGGCLVSHPQGRTR